MKKNQIHYKESNFKFSSMWKKICISILIPYGLITIVIQSCGQNDGIQWSNSKQGVFTDIRDNKNYKVVKIGTQTLMAENLAYKPISGNFWAYDNDENNVKKYGYLYAWATAKHICPVGWHLPVKEEWETLYKFLGGSDEKVYNALKQNGSFNFDLVLGGYYEPRKFFFSSTNANLTKILNNEFFKLGKYAGFWSATGKNEEQAWYFSFDMDSCRTLLKQEDTECGFSVRLFQDHN